LTLFYEKKKQVVESIPAKKPPAQPVEEDFYTSWEWTTLRYKVLLKYGPKCMCCGASRADGAVIHVDHIKPRKKYPDLALDFNNMQVLCAACNKGKGAWDETDHRPKRGPS
jgi:5-methylcytosine-specific restriction endonuclease McrA